MIMISLKSLATVVLSILGLVLFLVVVSYKSSPPTRWTGFYYAFSDDGNHGASIKFNIKAPTNRSEFDAFNSLEECDSWAAKTRRSLPHKPGDPDDLYYCAKGCQRTWVDGGIDCLDPTGVLSSFETKY